MDKILGIVFRKVLRHWHNTGLYNKITYKVAKRKQNNVILDIRERNEANVFFFASSLAMWHYQGLVNLLIKDSHFHVFILLCPYSSFSEDERIQNIEILKDYFTNNNLQAIDTTQWKNVKRELKQIPEPDILFYPQPYEHLYGNELDSSHYYNKLLCYCPYAVNTISDSHILNTTYHHCSWKIYLETEFHQAELLRFVPNQAENVCVVGNTEADEYLNNYHRDIWKPLSGHKRVIWAPHFSFQQSSTLHRGSFLWMADLMLEIAQQYSSQLQFCFKPHPRLKSELYKLPDWGKDRTDAYYRKWMNMFNTQYEEGTYFDLFMTSDAMIHDCGSFTASYHYSRKPVMFVSKNLDVIKSTLNGFGKEALDMHYIGKCKADIVYFLDNVVLGDNDPLKEKREQFFTHFLLPPSGISVSENIYNDMVKSLFLK